MTHDKITAVVVNDREIRDLICLNLRFESIKTICFESLSEFLKSDVDIALMIIDLCGERDPNSKLKQVAKKVGDDISIVALTDRTTSPLKHEYTLEVQTQNSRKRFDASLLIKIVTNLIESRQQVQLKHHLTGLPSGNAVEKHILTLLAAGKNFSLISTDIDNMKAFNQRFGYAEGDDLLIRLVKLMNKVLKNNPDNLNFMGHRGEDDFVIITNPNQALEIGREIVDSFDKMIHEFFTEKDIKRGYYTMNDRRGNQVKLPLTTISLAVINTERHSYTHPVELYDVAEELMSKVKMRGIHQSYCAIEDYRDKPDIKNIFI